MTAGTIAATVRNQWNCGRRLAPTALGKQCGAQLARDTLPPAIKNI
jgi:hypothetical protein